MPAAPTSIRLLGMAAWRQGASDWVALSAKDAALLALLSLEGEQKRTHVAALLWPDVAGPRSHANLRQRLFRLRQQLGPVFAQTDHGLALAPELVCDAHREGCSDDADLALPLLAGLDLRDLGDDLSLWVAEAQQRWAARTGDLLAARAARQEAAGQLAAAMVTCEQILTLEPLLEHAWRRLMRLHYLRGDRGAAVRTFERCERVLKDELGLRPSLETTELLTEVERLQVRGQEAQPASSRVQPLTPALLRPPLTVGRAAEQQHMALAWQQGRAFLLLGEAGLGKSRLLAELAGSHAGALLSQAMPGDRAVPYATLVRLLRALLHTQTDLPSRLGLLQGTSELARLLPELGSLPTSPGVQALLTGAVEQLLQEAVACGLKAVLLDDLHHADEASLHLLQRLAATDALNWGFASRPLPGEAWREWLGSSARVEVLALRGLDVPDLQRLVQSLHLTGLDGPALVPALASHCGGNPLFVLETLKHLLLAAAPAGAAPGRLPLPPTVEMALLRRMQSLSEEAQSLVHVAAVAVADFSAELAADVMSVSMFALAQPLAELEAAQLMRGEALAHEAVLQVARRALPQALGRALHARVALSLAARGGPPMSVAGHHADAQEWVLAGRAASQAAARSLVQGRAAERLSQLRQAAAWFRTGGDADAAFCAEVASVDACMAQEGSDAALALAHALTQAAITRPQRLAIRLVQASVALAGYEPVSAIAAARAAVEEAAVGSHAALQGQVMLAAGLALAGDITQALRILEAHQGPLQAACLVAQPDLDLAELWSQCALVYYRAGRVQDCVAALQRQRELAHQSGHVESEVAALSSLSGQHVVLGQTDLAIREAREAAQIYRRLGADASAAMCDVNLAIALLGDDQLQEAKTLLDRALDFAQRTAADTDLPMAVVDLRATWWLRVGDAGLALSELDRATGGVPGAGRRLSRLTLRALAAEQQQDSVRAGALWQELRAMDAAGVDTLHRLRGLILSTGWLPSAAALQELQAYDEQATAGHFHAARARVRLQRAPLLLQLGRLDEARLDAMALLDLRPWVRHRFVSSAELVAVVCRVFDAVGETALASSLRAAEQARATHTIRPQLTLEQWRCWQLHSRHQGLGLERLAD